MSNIFFLGWDGKLLFQKYVIRSPKLGNSDGINWLLHKPRKGLSAELVWRLYAIEWVLDGLLLLLANHPLPWDQNAWQTQDDDLQGCQGQIWTSCCCWDLWGEKEDADEQGCGWPEHLLDGASWCEGPTGLVFQIIQICPWHPFFFRYQKSFPLEHHPVEYWCKLNVNLMQCYIKSHGDSLIIILSLWSTDKTLIGLWVAAGVGLHGMWNGGYQCPCCWVGCWWWHWCNCLKVDHAPWIVYPRNYFFPCLTLRGIRGIKISMKICMDHSLVGPGIHPLLSGCDWCWC